MKLYHDPDNTQVQLSASALDYFFTCPGKLLMSSSYEPITMAQPLLDGIHTHRMLAGESVPEASEAAVGYYESLFDLSVTYGIEVYHKEVEQTFEIDDGLWYKRIIDGIGSWQGLPVLIDWKTSAKGPWPYFRGADRRKIVPKGLTFQAVSYLIPPPDKELERLGMQTWPEQILFLVSDAFGHGDMVAYHRDPDMERNFYNACHLAAFAIQSNNLPFNFGNACGVPGAPWSCQFIEACYDVPGWEEKFNEVGGSNGHHRRD